MKNRILEKKKKGNFVGKFISSGHSYISPKRKGAVGDPLGGTCHTWTQSCIPLSRCPYSLKDTVIH